MGLRVFVVLKTFRLLFERIFYSVVVFPFKTPMTWTTEDHHRDKQTDQ